jgi:hypothetical protein
MPTFAVRTVHRSGWDPRRPMREQDAWDDQAAFMNGLAADGFVILGGPLGLGGQDNASHRRSSSPPVTFMSVVARASP